MRYEAWVIKLANGKLANDDQGRPGPAQFTLKRECEAWWKTAKPAGAYGAGKPVKMDFSARAVS